MPHKVLIFEHKIFDFHVNLQACTPGFDTNLVQIYRLFAISQFLLVEETGAPRENNQTVESHLQTLLHNVIHLALIKIRTHNISGDIYDHGHNVPSATKQLN
jgi:hypothetical protein